MSLPSTKKRETRTQFQTDTTIILLAQIGSGNVANFVTVINVSSQLREQSLNTNCISIINDQVIYYLRLSEYLESFYAGETALFTLVFKTGERTLELSSSVVNV